MVGGPANKPLREAGKTAVQLEAAVASMELDEADQVLIDAAMSLAAKLDSLTDERLLIRYHAHYLRAVSALSKKSDENRARRLADEARQREEAARQQSRRDDPLAQLRIRRRQDDAEREAYERREQAKAARLKAKGLTMDQIAAQMKCHRSVIVDYLKAHRARQAEAETEPA